jgi:hypothetical protein
MPFYHSRGAESTPRLKFLPSLSLIGRLSRRRFLPHKAHDFVACCFFRVRVKMNGDMVGGGADAFLENARLPQLDYRSIFIIIHIATGSFLLSVFVLVS